MSMKFVHTSDNKYVQYRYMGTATSGSPNPFLDEVNWQGVDDEPTAESDNLVKSGGVYNYNNLFTHPIANKIIKELYVPETDYTRISAINISIAAWEESSSKYRNIINIKNSEGTIIYSMGFNNHGAYDTQEEAFADFISSRCNRVVHSTSAWWYLYADESLINTDIHRQPCTVNTDLSNLSNAPLIADYLGSLNFNYAQNLSNEQKTQARANLGFGDGYLDSEPIYGSENLVNSGGVYKIITDNINKKDIYNNENFIEGFYLLTQGVGGTAPDNIAASSSYACSRIEVKAGQIINLKTIGGKNARAYALTDVNRTILSVAPANADYSSGITLNVAQDGYLYVNTTATFLPNVLVAISGGSKTRIDILEDDVSELQNDVSELQNDVSELQNVSIDLSKIFNPHVDLTKDNLKILDIGNSFTGDAVHYLPNIIANYNIPNTYSLYEVIRGGSSFKTWVDCYKDNDGLSYYCSLVAGQSLSDVPTGSSTPMDGTLFRNILSSVKWDMIIIHQVSTYSANYELWEGNTDGGYLKEYIRILKLTNPQAKIGFYLVHSAPSNSERNPEHSSLLLWQKISKSVKWIMANYGVDFVIPYGTAIQNIRQCSIIDSNELSNDGRHNASGLADYTAACCYFQQLFGTRDGVNVIGDTFRVTVDETVAGQISVTDDTAPLAQKAAILACCDAFSISNPEENIL